MPFVKSLGKVQKKLAKQSLGLLHHKGRKFKQLNRAHERENKLQKRKADFNDVKNHELLFYLHMQTKITVQPQDVYTHDETLAFVEEHVARFDAEIAEHTQNRRAGRPKTNRHQILEQKRAQERHDLQTGFRVPDLGDATTVLRLRSWNGTSGASTLWKFSTVTRAATADTTEMDIN